MYRVAQALADFIWDNQANMGHSGYSIQKVLDECGQKLQAVHAWEPEILHHMMMPCICIGNPAMVKKDWYAAPYTLQVTWEVPISGYMVFDDTENNARAIQRFFTATERLFEDRLHVELPLAVEPESNLPEGHLPSALHYAGECPIVSGEADFDVAQQGDNMLFLRRFQASWRGFEIRHIAPGYEG